MTTHSKEGGEARTDDRCDDDKALKGSERRPVPVVLLPGIDPSKVSIAPIRPRACATLMARDADNPTGCVTFGEHASWNPEAIEAALSTLLHRDADGYRDVVRATCRPTDDGEGLWHEITFESKADALLLHVEVPDAHDRELLPATCVFTLYLDVHRSPSPSAGRKSAGPGDAAENGRASLSAGDRMTVNATTFTTMQACRLPGTVWASEATARDPAGQALEPVRRLVGFESKRGLCPLMLVRGVKLAFKTASPVREAHEVIVHVARMGGTVCDAVADACADAARHIDPAPARDRWPPLCTRWFFDSRVDVQTSGFFVARRAVRQFTGIREDLLVRRE